MVGVSPVGEKYHACYGGRMVTSTGGFLALKINLWNCKGREKGERKMENLRQWILDMAEGEEIEAVVIGEMGWGDYGKDRVPTYEQSPKGQILTWSEAEKYLDYEFNAGYGAPGCQAIYAWTATKIIAIGQYDGSTWPYSIPRHPIAVMPEMEGGG